jgi:hypothetical protein
MSINLTADGPILRNILSHFIQYSTSFVKNIYGKREKMLRLPTEYVKDVSCSGISFVSSL